MFVARILYPVEVLGPGRRIGLWLSGCGRRCRGCSNPELWTRREDQAISAARVGALLRRLAQDHPVDGVTVTGGEPMDQADELARLLPLLSALTGDILLYSGYTLEALRARKDPATDEVLRRIAVLVDGEYREEMNGGLPLRGSANQRIHLFNEAYRSRYERYLAGESRIQNFSLGDSVVSAGIHHPGYREELKNAARQKGLLENG